MKRDFVRDQVLRLMANPMLAPQTDEGTREVIDCLMRNCAAEADCLATVTAFLDFAVNPRNITAELASIARKNRRLDWTGLGDRAGIWNHERGCWQLLEQGQELC